MQLYEYRGVTLGSDPELFIKNPNGDTVGSEHLIPGDYLGKLGHKVIKDGVQVELNPHASSCREEAGGYIKKCFIALKAQLEKLNAEGAGFTLNMATVTTMKPEEFNTLSDRSKTFGCKPSFNVYDPEAVVGVDAATYMVRSAGGHIHLGSLPANIFFNKDAYKKRQGIYANPDALKKPDADYRRRLIPILDVLVGIPAVLIDRAPGQDERRKYYGRAGEYRLPQYGVEYRTLSNFWLRSYPLMGLMLGLARTGVAILDQTLETDHPQYCDFEESLLSKVDFKEVVQAINTNDVKLARKTFVHVENFIKKHVRDENATRAGGWPFNPDRVMKFKTFAKDVQKHGLESIFPMDPLEHWTTINTAARVGWESFIDNYTSAGK